MRAWRPVYFLYPVAALWIDVRGDRLQFEVRSRSLSVLFMVRRDIRLGTRPGDLQRFPAERVAELGLDADQLQQR